MSGKTHITAGVAFAVAWGVLMHDPLTPALVLGGGIGGLAPDLDHPQALLTRRLLGMRQASSIATHAGVWRHRGIAHSVLAWAVSTWLVIPVLGLVMAHVWYAAGVFLGHPIWVFAIWHWWGVGKRTGWAAGYASHMVVDALNTKGVQWFWPLPIWVKSPIPNIAVGTPPETIFRWLMLIALAVWHPLLGLVTWGSSEGVYWAVKH